MNRNLPHNQKGAIAIITLMAVSVFVLIVMTTVSALAANNHTMTSAATATEATFYAAEAGLNEALYRLIDNPVPQPFTLTVADVTVTVTVTANPDNHFQRIIVSQARDSTGKVRTLRIIANTNSFAGGFDYAIQSGHGGIEILNNSQVIGDIYTNGNIFGGTGSAIQATVNGNVWIAQGSPLVQVPSQLNSNTEIAFANNQSRLNVAQSIIVAADTPLKQIDLYIKRTGTLPADIKLKVIKDDGTGQPSSNPYDLIVEKDIKKNNIPTNFSSPLEVSFDVGPILFSGQTYWMILSSPTPDSTNYLVWQFNSDSNSYPDGQATGYDSSTNSWSPLNGDFKFRSYTGLGDTFIKRVEVNGDAHAHLIDNSEIAGDAYYQSINSGSLVGGAPCLNTNCHPGSPDPETKPFPIQDNDILNWKTEALSGGEIGDQEITGNANLGPKKINGNLSLSDNAHLNITGTLWVTGNVTFTKPGLHLSLDSSFGAGSGVLIADGKIDINNNTNITGSGDPNSFILILSTNNSLTPYSASNPNNKPAIRAANNSNAVIFYAKNGMVQQYNGSHLNATSGYYVRLEEQSSITYDPNLQAFAVPSGGSDEVGTSLGTWEEL